MPRRPIRTFETVGSIKRRTGKNVYRVVLSEIIYVVAKNQRQCDKIVCESRYRWARYESAELVEDKKQKIFGYLNT